MSNNMWKKIVKNVNKKAGKAGPSLFSKNHTQPVPSYTQVILTQILKNPYFKLHINFSPYPQH